MKNEKTVRCTSICCLVIISVQCSCQSIFSYMFLIFIFPLMWQKCKKWMRKEMKELSEVATVDRREYFWSQGGSQRSLTRPDSIRTYLAKYKHHHIITLKLLSSAALLFSFTFNLSLSKYSSCCPSTPFAVNSGVYWSMFMPINQ